MNALTPIETGAESERKGHAKAKQAMQRWDELKADRAEDEQDWSDIAKLIRPQRGDFLALSSTATRREKPLSSEPIMANSSFAAGIYSGITNPANKWFGCETPDEDFNNWQPMREWLDTATARVAKSFMPSLSSFYPSTFQAYADLAAFGNAPCYDEFDPVERRFLDITHSLAEVQVDIDGWGRVREWVRRFQMRPRAAVLYFKGRGELPACVHELADKGDMGRLVFFHHILPNAAWRKGAIGPRGKPFASVYVCEAEQWLISERGYDEFPAYFPRWDVDSGRNYGFGPGFVALASARAVHQMEAATLRAAQYAADPTNLAPSRDDWPLNGTVRPGSTVYGGINMRGDMMVRRLEGGGALGLTLEEKRAKVEEIKNAYHYAIMSLVGRTGLNPQETMIIEEARMREWAPHADRIMEEYAARKVERRFAQLWRMGQIPAPPQGAAGMPLQVRYTSASQMAMSAREGLAIVQFVADLGPLAATSARYLDRLDPDATIEALHAARPSLPARILRPREEADQIAAERVQQQEAMQQMAMLSEGAGAAKDGAAAVQALAGAIQGGGGPG